MSGSNWNHGAFSVHGARALETCQVCMDKIRTDDAYVIVSPSWERHNHRIHKRCWQEIMCYAEAGLCLQAGLFSDPLPPITPIN